MIPFNMSRKNPHFECLGRKRNRVHHIQVDRQNLSDPSFRSSAARILEITDNWTSLCIPGHTGFLGTLALTQTAVSADSAGRVELTSARAGVHGDGLADDEAIADKLADGLARVGVGDLVHLIGVEPDLALAAADHGGREALLGAKVDPVCSEKIPSVSRIS